MRSNIFKSFSFLLVAGLTTAGCGDLLGADFSGGILRTDDAGATSTDAPATEPTPALVAEAGVDAGAGRSPQVVMFGGWDEWDHTTPADTWTWDGTTWTRLTPSPHPTARYDHAMATLGHSAVLYGGWDGAAKCDDTWVWDGAHWEEKHPLHSPGPLSQHLMATQNDHVVLFDRSKSQTWTWDGNDWTAVSTAGAPSSRGACMAQAGNQVLLFGGVENNGLTAETWLFGPSWSQVSVVVDIPARADCTITTLPGGRAVLFGGSGFDDAWAFEASHTWSELHTVERPPGRAGHASAALGNKVVVYGGSTAGDVGIFFDDTWTFDGTAWTEAPPSAGSPGYRWAHAMASIP